MLAQGSRRPVGDSVQRHSSGKGENDPLGREHPWHWRETHWHPARGRRSQPEPDTEARRAATGRPMGAHRGLHPILAVPYRPRGTTQLSPHCKVADTNEHYRHCCEEPTVVAARRKHLTLLSAATPHTVIRSDTQERAQINHSKGTHINVHPGQQGDAH